MAYVERSTGGDDILPSGDVVSFTYSPAAGSNRCALITCVAANLNDQVNTCWPASLTWGGQTINRTISVTDNNIHAALYPVFETAIAALSGGSLSVSLVDEGTNIGTIENMQVIVALYADVEQAFIDTDSVLDAATLTLTTASGDLVFALMGSRSDNTPTSADTVRWDKAGTGAVEDAGSMGTEKTASGTSTQIAFGGSPAQCAEIAVVMRPAAAAATTSDAGIRNGSDFTTFALKRIVRRYSG